jgi:pimeloyl-ACP methyl ester carboxylesterase
VTIAGNLDHRAWTESYGLAPLNESLNLADYRNEFLKVPQVHYVGGRDDAISPALTRNFVADSAKIVEIKEAGHQTGWEKAYSAIWNE